MNQIEPESSRTRRFSICLGLGLFLGWLGISLPVSQSEERWVGGFSIVTFLKEKFETGNVHAATIRRAPRVHRPVARPLAPRRSVRRQAYRGTTTVVVAPPGDCEEVSGEEGVLYCDGMYYRARFQGDQVVYVPEAEAEPE